MNQPLPQVLKTLKANEQDAMSRLFDFLRIPSISTDPTHKDDCKRAADWCASQLQDIGFTASIHPTKGHPMVVAHDRKSVPKGMPHVLFYGHYDVQPVDPLNLWECPPFEPRVVTTPDGTMCLVAAGRDFQADPPQTPARGMRI